MRAARMQTTLAGPCSVSGRGYWSGESNTLTFLPAPANFGVQFVRCDLPGQPRIRAVAENRISMPLRTRLSQNGVEVDMVEHVLATLYGLRLDNVEVRCTASEMPGMDGSSLAFALALRQAGEKRLDVPQKQIIVTSDIRVGSNEAFVHASPTRFGGFELEYQLDYGPHSPIGQAVFRAQLNPSDFVSQIAPARTFVTQAEASALQQQGLGTHVTTRDLLVFGEHGPLQNQLRFNDECARHKALDLIGDLALAGADLVGRFVAKRSGHQLNGQMADQLRALQRQSDPDVREMGQHAA